MEQEAIKVRLCRSSENRERVSYYCKMEHLLCCSIFLSVLFNFVVMYCHVEGVWVTNNNGFWIGWFIATFFTNTVNYNSSRRLR
jgi:hypothetical protein